MLFDLLFQHSHLGSLLFPRLFRGLFNDIHPSTFPTSKIRPSDCNIFFPSLLPLSSVFPRHVSSFINRHWKLALVHTDSYLISALNLSNLDSSNNAPPHILPTIPISDPTSDQTHSFSILICWVKLKPVVTISNYECWNFYSNHHWIFQPCLVHFYRTLPVFYGKALCCVCFSKFSNSVLASLLLMICPKKTKIIQWKPF